MGNATPGRLLEPYQRLFNEPCCPFLRIFLLLCSLLASKVPVSERLASRP